MAFKDALGSGEGSMGSVGNYGNAACSYDAASRGRLNSGDIPVDRSEVRKRVDALLKSYFEGLVPEGRTRDLEDLVRSFPDV